MSLLPSFVIFLLSLYRRNEHSTANIGEGHQLQKLHAHLGMLRV